MAELVVPVIAIFWHGRHTQNFPWVGLKSTATIEKRHLIKIPTIPIEWFHTSSDVTALALLAAMKTPTLNLPPLIPNSDFEHFVVLGASPVMSTACMHQCAQIVIPPLPISYSILPIGYIACAGKVEGWGPRRTIGGSGIRRSWTWGHQCRRRGVGGGVGDGGVGWGIGVNGSDAVHWHGWGKSIT